LIKNKKSLTDGLMTPMKNETESINRYYWYQFIDPSLIVPSYAYR
jgi:hypothetical protein